MIEKQIAGYIAYCKKFDLKPQNFANLAAFIKSLASTEATPKTQGVN